MPLRSVQLIDDDYRPRLEVEGGGVLPHNEAGDGFVGTLEVAAPAGLTSLRRALRKHAGDEPPRRFTAVNPRTGETFEVLSESPEVTILELVDAPEARFARRHTYEFLVEPVAIALRPGGALAVRAQFVVEGDEEPDSRTWRAVLTPVLSTLLRLRRVIELERELTRGRVLER